MHGDTWFTVEGALMFQSETSRLALEKQLILRACPQCGGKNFDYLGQDQFECIVCHEDIQFDTVTDQNENLAKT